MFQKAAVVLSINLVFVATGFVAPAHAAATVKNGVACSKLGSSTTVTIKAVKKIYICTVNPAAAGNPNVAKGGNTWTLKTCVSYYAAYKSNQKAIDDQRSLVSLMGEPDKSTYTTQLNNSQANLMQVLASIENNHCKTGL